jgi:hypothetical protein
MEPRVAGRLGGSGRRSIEENRNASGQEVNEATLDGERFGGATNTGVALWGPTDGSDTVLTGSIVGL